MSNTVENLRALKTEAIRMPTPVGEMKRLVSLVDRGDADTFFFPQDAANTVFQPNFKPYHNFVQETLELPYTGAATWGQRITFTLPFPWLGDCLNWVAIRFAPASWIPGDAVKGLQYPVPKQWLYTNVNSCWTWAQPLGSIAIELVEMEVNGIVVEQWSGDWIDVWQKLYLDPSRSAGWRDSVVGRADTFEGDDSGINTNDFNARATILPTEDGQVYAYFPFWFARRRNAAFPLVSVEGSNVRFHITFRPFKEVVRKVVDARGCDETMLGSRIDFINNDVVGIPEPYTATIEGVQPNFTNAVLVCGFTQIDEPLRNAYIQNPHECLIEPVINIPFNEPLKYVSGKADGEIIKISLPLVAANGPIREIIWFLRRKSASKFNSWTNYGAYLENEVDPLYRPQRSLMTTAVLRVGAVVWAEQPELWWRSRGALTHPGGIQAFESYVYAYSFANDVTEFGPTGSINASRAEMRLDLTIQQPSGIEDREFEVQVFIVSHNWMRFQNGMAEVLFRD
jgi:hypothetical protein